MTKTDLNKWTFSNDEEWWVMVRETNVMTKEEAEERFNITIL